MTSNQVYSRSVAKSLCKFCEGAGEPKEVYTSHWQFSKPVDGVLTCPKLLNYKCKLCNCFGHIEKRCLVPKPKKDKQEYVDKFCRFCFNAKNPAFLSHNQFNKDGLIQCTTLLEIECQTCGEKGHTKRYCKKTETLLTPVKCMNKAVPGAPQKPANKFACLLVEEEVDTLQSGNLAIFPMLSQKQVTASIMSGWATAVVARPAAPPPTTSQDCEPVSDYDDEPFVLPSTSWADM